MKLFCLHKWVTVSMVDEIENKAAEYIVNKHGFVLCEEKTEHTLGFVYEKNIKVMTNDGEVEIPVFLYTYTMFDPYFIQFAHVKCCTKCNKQKPNYDIFKIFDYLNDYITNEIENAKIKHNIIYNATQKLKSEICAYNFIKRMEN